MNREMDKNHLLVKFLSESTTNICLLNKQIKKEILDDVLTQDAASRFKEDKDVIRIENSDIDGLGLEDTLDARSVQGKVKKEVLTEDSNKTDENLETDLYAEENITEEPPKSSKCDCRKRKQELVTSLSPRQSRQSSAESDSFLRAASNSVKALPDYNVENILERTTKENEEKHINFGPKFSPEEFDMPKCYVVLKRLSSSSTKDACKAKPKSKKAKKAPLTAEDKEDNTNLPKGWVRKTVVRKSGKTAGQIDVYIYSPDGIKFRSRPDVRAYLAKTKSNLKLEDFNFSKKASSSDSLVKLIPKKEKTASTTKPKSTPEKKRAKEPTTPKKTAKLLVKLKISPKKSKEKKVANKSTKEVQSSAKNKASGSGPKISKKKKNA